MRFTAELRSFVMVKSVVPWLILLPINIVAHEAAGIVLKTPMESLLGLMMMIHTQENLDILSYLRIKSTD